MKREDIKKGHRYSLDQDDNVFEVLATHGSYHWVVWLDDNDVESIHFDKSELKQIKEVKLNSLGES